jgi:hypothetical protein
MAAARNPKRDIRRGQAKIGEMHTEHGRVLMLAGMQQNGLAEIGTSG